MKKRMPAICVKLKPSKIILGLYVLFSILCCFALFVVNLSIIAKIGLILTAILWTTYVVMRDALLALPWSWQQINVNSEGLLILTNAQQNIVKPQLLKSTFIHPYLTVLVFKHAGNAWYQSNAIVITPWQIQDKESYRQLRVWLKWWPHQTDFVTEEYLSTLELD